MEPTNWGHFLLTRRATDTPRGDFLMDARWDPKMLNCVTLAGVLARLAQKNACTEAVQEGKKLWAEYEKWLTKAN